MMESNLNGTPAPMNETDPVADAKRAVNEAINSQPQEAPSVEDILGGSFNPEQFQASPVEADSAQPEQPVVSKAEATDRGKKVSGALRSVFFRNKDAHYQPHVPQHSKQGREPYIPRHTKQEYVDKHFKENLPGQVEPVSEQAAPEPLAEVSPEPATEATEPAGEALTWKQSRLREASKRVNDLEKEHNETETARNTAIENINTLGEDIQKAQTDEAARQQKQAELEAKLDKVQQGITAKFAAGMKILAAFMSDDDEAIDKIKGDWRKNREEEESLVNDLDKSRAESIASVPVIRGKKWEKFQNRIEKAATGVELAMLKLQLAGAKRHKERLQLAVDREAERQKIKNNRAELKTAMAELGFKTPRGYRQALAEKLGHINAVKDIIPENVYDEARKKITAQMEVLDGLYPTIDDKLKGLFRSARQPKAAAEAAPEVAAEAAPEATPETPPVAVSEVPPEWPSLGSTNNAEPGAINLSSTGFEDLGVNPPASKVNGEVSPIAEPSAAELPVTEPTATPPAGEAPAA